MKTAIVLSIVLMSSRDALQPGRFVFIAVIFIAVLIDAFLFAQMHASYVHNHGYDLRPRHPAVAKPAPP